MHRSGQDRWTYSGKLKTGASHSFYYMVDGQESGRQDRCRRLRTGLYEQPGVPHGKLSEKIVHTSKIYDGMQSNYWIYVPAQYDPAKAAALMVWQDARGESNATAPPDPRSFSIISRIRKDSRHDSRLHPAGHDWE